MTITCVYSSGWGNTRLVVERLQELLAAQWVKVTLINAVNAVPADFCRSESDVTVLACPTYDHGVLHTPFATLLHAAKDVALEWKRFGVIGLGDDKYDQEYTMYSADILEEFVGKQWWTVIVPALRINKHPLRSLEKELPAWTEDLLAAIGDEK